MPVRKEEQYVNEVLSNRGFKPEPPPETIQQGSVGVSTAAFGESFLGKMSMAGYDHFLGPKFHADPEYDAYDDIIADDASGWAGYLGDAGSKDEYMHRKAMVDQSVENERILADGGWSGVGYQLMWGLADPVNFVPMMGAASKVAKATKSIGATALATGTIGAAAQGIQEAVVAQVDPNFNQDDALMAIGAVGALSAVMGPLAMQTLDPSTRDAFSKGYDNMLRGFSNDVEISNFGAGTGGAARVTDGITKETLEPLNTLGVARTGQFIGPQTRLRASPSEAVRRFNAQINETSLMTKGNMQGQASMIPIEAEKRVYFALESNAREMTQDAYMSYRKSLTGKTGNWLTNDVKDVTGLSNKSGILTRQQFYDRVGMAMRRNDKSEFTDFADANPFIEQAASANRQVSGVVLKEMLDSGYLKDMPDLQGTAESWFMRIYNHDKIVADREAFEYGLTQYYIKSRDETVAQLSTKEAELQSARVARETLRRSLGRVATDQRVNERETLKEMSRLDGKIRAHERDLTKIIRNYDELQKRASAVEPMDITKKEKVNFDDLRDTKVLDDKGNPRIVYHGTTKDFDGFDVNSFKTGNVKGIYFTPDKNSVWLTDKTRGDIKKISARVLIKNPASYSDFKRIDKILGEKSSPETIQAQMKSEGFDGYIDNDVHNEIVVFENDQVKVLNKKSLSPQDQYMKDLLKDIKGNPLGRLDEFRLLPTIRKLGGIAEDKEAMGPDLMGQSTAGQNNRQDVRGILDTQARSVFRRDGKPLDMMREALAERGWLPEDSDVNDLLNLIEQDAKTSPVYDPAVMDKVIDAQSRADMIDELDLEMDRRLGVSLANIKTAKELDFYMGQLNGGDAFKEFSPSTTAQRAKYREMQLNLSRYERTINSMNNDLDDALTDLMSVKKSVDEIRANRTNVADVLKQGRKDLAASSKNMKKMYDDIDTIKFKGKIWDEELQGNARTTVERILGSPMGLLEYEDVMSSARGVNPAKAGTRGNKARKLTMPDTYQWEFKGKKYSLEDFLHSDPNQMMSAQMRSVVPDLLMYRRFGTVDEQHILQAVVDDYRKIEEDAKIPKQKKGDYYKKLDDAGFTPKQKAQLEKRKNQDLEDLRDTIAIHRGLYANRDDYFKALPTALRTMRQVNYLSLMGEMAISSAADVGTLVSQYGMRKVFGNLLPSFVEGMRSDLRKMSMDDAKKMIVGVESVMNDRYAKIYDADVYAPAANKVEGGLNYMSGAMQKVSLMNIWLDALRPLAAVLEQDRIVTLAMKQANGQRLTKLETAEIGARFLSKEDMAVIADQFTKHGSVEGGGIGGRLYVPNIKSWDVDNAVVADVQRRLRVAVAKEVDTLIIKPGTEIPKTMKKGGAVTSIMQFKSFMFAANDRLLARSAQRLALGDKRLVMGMTSLVGLGMMSYAIKATLAGKETSDKPQDWLMEGIDRSGMLGFFGEVNNITEKLSANRIGMRPALGVSPATRYINRNTLETALGPSARVVQDFGTTTQSLSTYGNMTETDLNRWRRYMPFQNAIGFRYLYDGMVDGTSDIFNLPEKR
jgi:hypothetical protein